MTLEARMAALATRIGNYLRDTITPRAGQSVKLGADTGQSTNSNNAITSGLQFAALANKTYLVEFVGAFTAAATTTGIGLQLDIPSGAVWGLVEHHSATTQTLTGHEQVADNATPQASSGVRAAATSTPVVGRWIVEIGATPGNVILMFKPEVNSSAVVLKKPSALLWRELA